MNREVTIVHIPTCLALAVPQLLHLLFEAELALPALQGRRRQLGRALGLGLLEQGLRGDTPFDVLEVVAVIWVYVLVYRKIWQAALRRLLFDVVKMIQELVYHIAKLMTLNLMGHQYKDVVHKLRNHLHYIE
jgi:hypothetical protein